MHKYVLVVPLVLALMGSIVGIAHATNEGSYRFGYSAGHDDYYNCFIGDCSPPEPNEVGGICVVGNQAVTNSTACVDGYVQGWQHWCKSDTKDCVEYMMEGRLPGAIISAHNVYDDGTRIELSSCAACR
jgi:hypothetical protein